MFLIKSKFEGVSAHAKSDAYSDIASNRVIVIILGN